MVAKIVIFLSATRRQCRYLCAPLRHHETPIKQARKRFQENLDAPRGPNSLLRRQNVTRFPSYSIYIYICIYIYPSWRVTPLSTYTPKPCYPTIHVRVTPVSTCIRICKYSYLGGFGAVPAVLCGLGNYVGSGDGVPQHASEVSEKQPVLDTAAGYDF